MNLKKYILIMFLTYFNILNANNTANFTKEEEQWLNNNPSINIADTLSGVYDNKGNNIHTDLLKLLNKYGGTNLVAIKFNQWEEAFTQASNGKLVFGILNLSYTKERSKKYFNYTMAYNFDPLYLIVKDSNTTISSLKDLEHKTIYVTKKSSTNNTIKDFTKNVKAIRLNSDIAKDKSLFENKDKNIVGFLTYTTNNHDIKKYKLRIAKTIYNKYGNIYIGINKKYKELHSIINKIFAIIPKEELSNLRNKIYENKKVAKNNNKTIHLGLTVKEKKWISRNTVSIGVEDWSPVIFMNPYLEIDGISGDFIKLIINRTGLNVKYINNTWDKLLNDFKHNKIDILPATYYTKKRPKYGFYSDGYFKVKDYIYVKKDNDTILSMKDLEGKTLVMKLGSGSIDKIKEKFPKINIITSESLYQSMNFVLNKNSDALFDGQIVVEKKINDEFIFGLKGISQSSFESPSLHIFSNINKPILASIMQKGLQSISIEKKVEISNKWLQTINNDMNNVRNINESENIKKYIEETSLLSILSWGELLFAMFALSILLLVIYYNYSKSKILNTSINKFILLIVAFELSVIFFLIYEIINLDRAENELALVYNNKTNMVQVMQKLRQSSDDLTKSARAYAISKDEKFKKQYLDILDIRNGLKVRPAYYDFIYWDLSKERREEKHKGLKKESLKSIISKLPFNSFQKNLLKISEFNSNDLVNIEKDAFQAIEDGNQKLAIKLLYSKQYDKEKEKIMIPLDDLVISMYKEMDYKIALLNKKIKSEFIYIIIVGIFFILGNFIIYLMIMKKITQPLEYLSKVIENFKKNKINIPQKTFYKDEIGETIQQFFNMKASIEEQQKDLNNLNINLEKIIENKTKVLNIQKKELQSLINGYDQNVIASRTDVYGNIIYVSKAFCEINGYLPNELIGKNHNIIKHEDTPMEVFQDMWKTIKSKKIWRGELKNKKKNGDFYWAYSIVSPDFNENGKIITYNSIRQDITAKKDLDQLLESLEEKVKERTLELNNEKKYINSVINSQNNIVITSDSANLKTVNKSFLKFFDISNKEEFISKFGNCISSTFLSKHLFKNELWLEYFYKQLNKIDTIQIQKNEIIYTFTISVDKFNFNNDILYTAVFTDITEFENIRKQIEIIHKYTKESIEYSSLIQHSIIPEKALFAKYFKEYFVIWNPKDIIGGDIYLFNEINKDECIFMIIDCTGHGVPGAFVTMLVKALEREIFSQIINDKGMISTSDILKKFNIAMKSILKQENNESISNAGFDGGIIYYNRKEQIMKFSGANNELFIVKDNNLTSIKGNRHSIGYRTSDVNYEFTEHIINTKDNIKFYMTTDGYLDQNGGEKGFPFGKKRFKNIIRECYNEEFINQQEIFLDTLYEYQGEEETNDDITLIAFKI